MRTTSFIAFVLLCTALSFVIGRSLRPGYSINQAKSIEPSPTLQAVSVSELTSFEGLIGETLFDNHHARAVKVFDQLPGFGFDRILPTIIHDFNKPMIPGQTDLFSSYDFTFIGNDADSRRQHSVDIPFAPAAFNSPGKGRSTAVPASGADLLALERFGQEPTSRRHFHIDGNSLVGYGPLRATTSCAKCHGVEEGTLLGMFRYRFDMPTDITFQELAQLD